MNKTSLVKGILINFLTIVTINVAFAESNIPFVTKLGFKRLSAQDTPKSLIKAAESVFEVRSISEDKVEDLQVWDLTSEKFSNIDSKIDSVAALDDKEKLIIKRQIKNCRDHGNEKECTVFLGIEKGTAFIAGDDGTSLWTNAHLVSRFIKLRAALAKKPVEEILKTDGRVAIFLFDSNGKLVFDPFTDFAVVREYPKAVSLAGALRGDWYSEDSDYVGIQLGQTVGIPLQFGPKPIKNETLYRAGFAACTGCSSNPNKIDPLLNQSRGVGQDSEGNGLYWTSGMNQEKDTVNAFLGRDLSGIFNMSRMVFFSADAQVGFSGAPILNTQGQVVGIFAGSKPKMYGSQMVVLSRGVRPEFFDLKK